MSTKPTLPAEPSGPRPGEGRRALVGGLAALGAAAALAGTVQAQPRGRFAGRVVLITGGNSGIGEATARAFAAEGATVLISARRDALGRAVEASIRNAGGTAHWTSVDVRDARQVQAWVEGAAQRFGRIDVLFNNAGIFMTPRPIEEIELENFADMMQTNVSGVFHGMKYALPLMKRQNPAGGVIVNMASVAAHRGFASTAHYNASKHAVIGLTRAAANANARHGVRVVSISPLAVDTPMLRESFAFQGVTYEQMAPNFVTPRIMAASEMASAVMLLCDPSATALAGMDLDVTGGQLA